MTDLNFQLARLLKKHQALHAEIEFLEAQREHDRSYLASVTLKQLKRQKLQLKDSIAALEAQLKSTE
jgi:uncharacterized protein YdcH (DUF465 family)